MDATVWQQIDEERAARRAAAIRRLKARLGPWRSAQVAAWLRRSLHESQDYHPAKAARISTRYGQAIEDALVELASGTIGGHR